MKYTRATYGYDQQGQLTSAMVGGTSYTYTYDTAGNIQSKKVGSTTTNYTYGNSAWRDLLTAYNGGSITYSGGNPTKYYDGSTFTWTQGRRLATAKVGSTNISYTYDPWGKIISSSGTLADINPLRYRGYYYDSETGFYYLQSRYYDPEIGRFINADSYASTDATGLLSTNMFAYCENDPVNRSDPSGELFGTISGLIVGGLTGALSAYINGDDILAGTITGAVNGGICGLIVDSGVFTGGISLLLCGVTGVLCEASNQAANGKTIKDMDYVSIGLSGLFSAISCGWSNSIEKVMKEASKTATNAVATIRGVGISLVGIGTSKTHNDIKSKKNKKISDDQMRRWERMTEYYRHQVIK